VKLQNQERKFGGKQMSKENKRKYYQKLYDKFVKFRKEIKDGRMLTPSEQTEYEELEKIQQSIITILKD